MSKEVKETKLDKLKKDYERNKGMKHMLDNGATLSEVAKKYGVSIGLPNHIRNNYEEVQERIQEKIKFHEWVVQLFKEGYTETEIGELEGVTKQNVSRILKSMNIDRSQGGRSKRRQDLMERIKTLVEEGFPVEDIAERLGENEMKVRQYIYKEGWDVPTSSSVEIRGRIDKILELRKEGFSQVEIGKKVGMSQAGVSNVLLKENMRTVKDSDYYSKRDNSIVKDFKEGMSVKELSNKYNLKEMNIRRVLYKHKG